MKSAALYDSLQAQLRAEFRSLRLVKDNGVAFIRGALPITSSLGTELDRFQIEIRLADDFPKTVPTIKETGGKIPRDPDRHINDDGTACLFVRDQTSQYWNEHTSIIDFIKGPVHQFFLSQIYFSEHRAWPFGQRPHGAEGIAQFYFDQLGTTNLSIVAAFLDCFISPHQDLKRFCFCGRQQLLKYCHLSQVLALRSKVPIEIARDSLKQIRLLTKLSGDKHRLLSIELAKSFPLIPYSNKALAKLISRFKYTQQT